MASEIRIPCIYLVKIIGGAVLAFLMIGTVNVAVRRGEGWLEDRVTQSDRDSHAFIAPPHHLRVDLFSIREVELCEKICDVRGATAT
jgi:hypothetical protein